MVWEGRLVGLPGSKKPGLVKDGMQVGVPGWKSRETVRGQQGWKQATQHNSMDRSRRFGVQGKPERKRVGGSEGLNWEGRQSIIGKSYLRRQRKSGKVRLWNWRLNTVAYEESRCG